MTIGAFPGRFDMVECLACHSAYLAQRPAGEALALAYAGYPTHERVAAGSAPVARSWPARVRQAVTGAYRDRRFRRRREWRGGLLAAPLLAFPGRRREIDNVVRFLPPAPGRLLDYGCGNGAFLDVAASYGWDVMGVDFDEETLRICRAAGLTVAQAATFDPAAHAAAFDAITLAHVLEHVPDPTGLLASLHLMLKPGGHLYLELPNVAALGHTFYGGAWRGLEVPRHFSLPTPQVLRATLTRLGFEAIVFHPRRAVFASIFGQSEQALAAAGASRSPVARAWTKLRARFTRRTEFLTVTARKRA